MKKRPKANMKAQAGKKADASPRVRARAESRVNKSTKKAATARHRAKQDTERLVHQLDVQAAELETLNEEIHRVREERDTAIQEAAGRFSWTVNAVSAGCFRLDRKGRFEQVNEAWMHMHGYTSPDEVLGQHFSLTQTADCLERAEEVVTSLLRGQTVPSGDFVRRNKDGSVGHHVFAAWPVKSHGKIVGVEGILIDTSARALAEEENRLALELLGLLNSTSDLHTLMSHVVSFLRERFDCEAVGIRLKEGNDYPYFECRGFPPEFVQAENHLCATDENNEALRDSMGSPVLECMCGNVICGRFDPAKPFFTANGSFWTNCTTELLATTTEADRQARTRNRCNGQGYESVALIRLCSGGVPVGLVQLNDRRRGRFTLRRIELLERMAGKIAIALAQRKAEKALLDRTLELDTVFHALPDQYFRLRRDGTILDCRGGQADDLHLSPGEFIGLRIQSVLPHEVGDLFEKTVRQAEESGRPASFEYVLPVPSGSKVFEARLQRLGEEEFVAVARDITNRKHADEAIERGRAELKAIYDSAPVMMCVVNERREVFYANRAFIEFTGRSDTELKAGRAGGVLGCVNALEDPRGCGFGEQCETCPLRLALADTLRTGESHRDIEYRSVLALNGSRREVVLLGSTALIQVAGKADLLLCLEDITQRKHAERQNEVLGRMAARLAAADSVDDMIDTVEDETGQLLSWDAHYFAVRRPNTDIFHVLRFVDTVGGEKRTFSSENWRSDDLSEPLKPLVRGEAVLINRAVGASEPAFEGFGDEGCASASLMYAPVRSGNTVIGILSAQSYAHFRYDEADIGLLQRVADIVAPALDRVCAEEALKNSEEKFSKAFLASPAPISIIRLSDNRMVEVNEAFEQLTGYCRDEMVGHTAMELGLWVDLGERENALGILCTNGRFRDLECRFRARGGHVIICRCSAEVVDLGGELCGLATLLDVTARRQAEEALRESESRYRTLFQHMMEGLAYCQVLYDEQGQPQDWVYLDVNDAFTRLTGLKEVVGRRATEVLPGIREACPELFEIYFRVASTRQPEQFEIDFKPLGMWLSVSAFSPAKECFVAVFEDITERKRAESALQASERKFRTLFDTMVEGVALHEVVRDADGKPADYRIIDVNAAYEKQTGLPATSARGALASQLYGTNPPPYLDVYSAVAETGQPDDMEVFFRPLQRHFRISIFSPGKGLFATVFEDMTESIRAEEERMRLEDQLRQVQKLEAVGQLAAGVAHDFNNLLSVIRGQALQIAAAGSREDAIREPLAMIEEAVAQAGEITRSLLTFSRVMPSEKKLLRLCGVVRESERLLRHVLPARIRLETVVSEECDCWVNADRTQLHQIILNLAINARDAMPSGGTLTIAVDLAEHPAGCAGEGTEHSSCGFVRLAVTDTGMGIPPAVRSRVFEPFFTTKPRGEGTGLGLSIVHGIVTDHDGEIEVESQVNAGTRFVVLLPCVPSPEPDETVPEACRAVRGQGELIVLAERDPFTRGAIASFLESSGYRVLLATSEEAVLDLVSQHQSKARLAILGSSLSGHGRCLDQMRGIAKGLPAIILRGASDAIRKPMDDLTTIVPEPFGISELSRMVGYALGKGGRGEVRA